MDLHGFFKYGAGYDQVELLPNPSSKKEVLGRVRSMTSGLGPGDFFLFFFAGHGFRVGENHVLVCSNDLYDDVKYEYDGLPLGQLKHRLSGAFNSALLLDACQSDILATRGGAGIAERDLSLIHEAPSDRSGGALTIVTSCDAGQTAAELSERRHGLFTVAMLDLLKEAQGAHVRLDLSDAFRKSLGRRMGEIAARFGLPTEQRPRFSCTGDSCFVLLDGLASAPVTQNPSPRFTPPPTSAIGTPMLVVCPVCGKKNHPEGTFKCRECGRDNLCLRHQDDKTFLCVTCMEKRAQEAECARLAALPKTGDVKTLVLPGGAEMEMIYVGPGSFMMGSPVDEIGRWDGEMQHRVTLTKGYWLGKYPVTQGQWQSVMGGNPSYFKGDVRLPVDCVSWNDCREFVEKVKSSAKQQLGGEARLPTEAEWEYACRAGSTTAYFWGYALNGDRANCDGNWPCGTSKKGPFLQKTTPVGSYGANAWGFADMHGNVLEWCADWYGAYSGDAVDPTGPASGSSRVFRGGSYSDDAQYCRSAYRYYDAPSYRYDGLGFRLSCSAGLHGRAEQ
jgi:formylglycine-generating enzyme required for sulfatase activity